MRQGSGIKRQRSKPLRLHDGVLAELKEIYLRKSKLKNARLTPYYRDLMAETAQAIGELIELRSASRPIPVEGTIG
jgi:hypothetical protein